MPKYTVPTGLWLELGFLFNSVACLKTKPSFAIAKQSSTRENQSTITTKVDTIINPAITKTLTFPNIILAAAAPLC
jgi:hypothetical protein